MSELLRHIFGFVVGVVLAPALPLAAGLATLQATRSIATNVVPTSQTMLAIGALVLVGAVIGAVASMRSLSPLAALVPGLAFLAVTGVYLVSPGTVLEMIPSDVLQRTGLLHGGVLALLGGVLVASALPAHRWRGRERGVTPDPSYLEPPSMPQPAEAWPSGPQPPGGFAPPSGPPRPPSMPSGGGTQTP